MTPEQKWKWFFTAPALVLLAIGLVQAYQPYVERAADVGAIRASIAPINEHGVAAKIAHPGESQGTSLFVYASWCGNCRVVMPYLAEILREKEFSHVRFLMLSIDEHENDLFDYLVRNRYDGLFTPYVLKQEQAGGLGAVISAAGGSFSGGIPYLLLLDAKGRMHAQMSGDIRREDLRNALAALGK